jgi:hypothetical protein
VVRPFASRQQRWHGDSTKWAASADNRPAVRWARNLRERPGSESGRERPSSEGRWAMRRHREGGRSRPASRRVAPRGGVGGG